MTFGKLRYMDQMHVMGMALNGVSCCALICDVSKKRSAKPVRGERGMIENSVSKLKISDCSCVINLNFSGQVCLV